MMQSRRIGMVGLVLVFFSGLVFSDDAETAVMKAFDDLNAATPRAADSEASLESGGGERKLEGGVWFSAGPVWRSGMDVSTSGGGNPASVGDAGSYADRTYDDGYVNQDPGTGNPASIDPNTTWFWGYDNAGQYNAGADTLSFHRAGKLDKDMSGQGIELILGLPLTQKDSSEKRSFGMDLCLGFQFIQADARSSDITDVYSTAGTDIAGNAPAPHRGTYDGPFDVPPASGVVIPNLPTQRIATQLKVDTDIYELWLGPKLVVDAADWISFYVTPKLSMNYVDVDISRSSAFANAGYSSGGGNGDFLFGAGAVGGVDIELAKGFFLNLWGGYEWVQDSVDTRLDGNTVSVNVSGYTAGASVGIRF